MAAISSTRSSESAAKSRWKLTSIRTSSGSQPRISAASSWRSRNTSSVMGRLLSRLCPQLGPPDHERRVMAAESEGVGDGHLDARGTCLVGHVVQVAFWVRMIEVDGGRDDAMLDGQNAGRGLHRPRSPEEMGMHGLGRADRQPMGMRTEHLLDGLGLGYVTQPGRGTVSVH